ncbi:MAG: signal recognition particle-docking protein FtsY [Anaerolineae bacterium]|nr:signal recognition particle-docking protein FtsY [Anaerolineae bacterium]
MTWYREEEDERVFRRSQPISDGLQRTRQGFFGRITGLFGGSDITEETWEELEALLIQADVGVATTTLLMKRLRERVAQENIRRADAAQTVLKQELLGILAKHPAQVDRSPRLLTVVLIVGVNGSGKTTSIAKLARYDQRQGKKVVLAAADTFRAAAIDQLKLWGERVGSEVIAGMPGADPGAVVYDAIRASQESRRADILIVDTAGRLHTKFNLMEELRKIRAIAQKQVHRAPHDTFLVLDATTGQNALAQAKAFKDAVEVTGVILAKLDSTAKGGMAFAIVHDLGLPIRFVGTGEKPENFAEFDAEAFVEGLFA